MINLPSKLRTDWLEALRSKSFEQGFGCLYDIDSNSYCCLGVLQMVANAKTEMNGIFSRGAPSPEWYANNAPELEYFSFEADADQHTMISFLRENLVKDCTLPYANDVLHYSFEEIATIIENNSVGV
jgi:hypothetical protein